MSRPPTCPRSRTRRARRPQDGAALLLALVVVTVISSLAATMVWQQWRSVQSEIAERAGGQAHWVLRGALDWGRLILREDARGSQIDHLGEPWAVPLQESRLSTFLADGREDLQDNEALQAFVSGVITDQQSKFNLRNLVVNGELSPQALRTLQRICDAAGAPPSTATTLLAGVRRSWLPPDGESATREQSMLLGPERLSDLTWWGLSPEVVEQLRPWIVVLPTATPLNVNTASAEMLALALEGVDLATAQRIVQARNNNPFRSPEQVLALLPAGDGAGRSAGLSVQSNFFEIEGRLRLGQRLYEQRILTERRQLDVVALQGERLQR